MEVFKVEQLNPNDSVFEVNTRLFEDGIYVKEGTLLFELEGQKTVFEVTAEKHGFISSAFFVGDSVSIDDDVYVLFDTLEDFLTQKKVSSYSYDGTENISTVNENNEPLSNGIVPEIMTASASLKVAVIPGGKAFRQVQDALEDNSLIQVVGFFDDQKKSSSLTLGSIDINEIVAARDRGEFDRIFVATGNAGLRAKILQELGNKGVSFINVIHPSAIISRSATIGANVFVGAQAVIGPKTQIGHGCFISAMSNVDHHCCLNQGVLLGPGVMLSGSVNVGAETILGAGVAVESNISIGSRVYIAPGTGITVNVKDNQRILGVKL
jgi:sugar O-acyltransferase (sialic acid O-acetyltransferase NeuD family)